MFPQIDETEYFVDDVDQYADYLRELGVDARDAPRLHIGQQETSVNASASRANTPANNNPNSTTTAPRYSNDTHWYSNVGGSIVRVNVEKRKMRKRGDALVIPGQALATSQKRKLRMNEPLIGLTARHYINEALSTGWIGVEGPHIKKFESALARICGCDAACAVQSGTAALYGAMKALGVSDEAHHVIVPTYTCAACADAIVHAGGVPIPVDCELESYGGELLTYLLLGMEFNSILSKAPRGWHHLTQSQELNHDECS